MATIAHLTGRLLAGAAVVVAVVLVGFMLVAPRVIGGATLNVLSGSMSPTIPTGSVVLIRPVEDPLALEVGDVITFQASPTSRSLVTHRIVRSQPDTTPPSYVTKGDANAGEDVDPVPVGAIRGTLVAHLPYVGYVSDRLGTPRVRLVLAMAIGLGVIGVNVRRLVVAVRDGDDAPPVTSPRPGTGAP